MDAAGRVAAEGAASVKLPRLKPAHVYLTSDLAKWSDEPTELAAELIKRGLLKRAARGIYYSTSYGRPMRTKQLQVDLVRAYLKGRRFLFTGHDHWLLLGLRVTFACDWPWIYNDRIEGERHLGRFTFRFVRAPFPDEPSPEWFLVDLLNNVIASATSPHEVPSAVMTTACEGRWNLDHLGEMTKVYGNPETQRYVKSVIEIATKVRGS